MTKPLNEFGGWLAFFNFTCWVGLIFFSFLSLRFWFIFPLSIFSALIAFFYFRKIKILKIKQNLIPKKIFELTRNIVLIICLAMFGHFVAMLTLLVLGSTWACIWGAYFSKSKRVLAYYGKNLTVSDICSIK